MTNKMNEYLKEIEKTFEALEKTIIEITTLKDGLDDIKKESLELKHSINEVMNNKHLESLKNVNNKAVEKVVVDISNISNVLRELDAYRKVYLDSLEDFHKRIEQDQKRFESESDSISKSLKAVSGNFVKFNSLNDQLSKSRNRLNKLSEEFQIVANYEKVLKEQKEQRVLLEQILSALNIKQPNHTKQKRVNLKARIDEIVAEHAEIKIDREEFGEISKIKGYKKYIGSPRLESKDLENISKMIIYIRHDSNFKIMEFEQTINNILDNTKNKVDVIIGMRLNKELNAPIIEFFLI